MGVCCDNAPLILLVTPPRRQRQRQRQGPNCEAQPPSLSSCGQLAFKMALSTAVALRGPPAWRGLASPPSFSSSSSGPWRPHRQHVAHGAIRQRPLVARAEVQGAEASPSTFDVASPPATGPGAAKFQPFQSAAQVTSSVQPGWPLLQPAATAACPPPPPPALPVPHWLANAVNAG